MNLALRLSTLFVIAIFLTGCLGGEKGAGLPPAGYTVSGVVVDEAKKGVEGVPLHIGQAEVVITEESGVWTVIGLVGEVAITPAHDDYHFEPESVTVTAAKADVKFTATLTDEAAVNTVLDQFLEATLNRDVVALRDTLAIDLELKGVTDLKGHPITSRAQYVEMQEESWATLTPLLYTVESRDTYLDGAFMKVEGHLTVEALEDGESEVINQNGDIAITFTKATGRWRISVMELF